MFVSERGCFLDEFCSSDFLHHLKQAFIITFLLYFIIIFVSRIFLQNAPKLQFLMYWKADLKVYINYLGLITLLFFLKALLTKLKKKIKIFLFWKTKGWSQNMQDIVLAFHLQKNKS